MTTNRHKEKANAVIKLVRDWCENANTRRIYSLKDFLEQIEAIVIIILQQEEEISDRLLSDMQKDSYAYCVGYKVGATIYKDLILASVVNNMNQFSEIQKEKQTTINSLNYMRGYVQTVFTYIPPPNPDDYGFGQLSEEDMAKLYLKASSIAANPPKKRSSWEPAF